MSVLTKEEQEEVRRKREKAAAIARKSAIEKGRSSKRKSLRERWKKEAESYRKHKTNK
ncbi:hypothetical protein [Staphylococcus pseudintermedius]|uniref:hypothetical protein n=1 Tax=Staphylococcus pseudintermedius TaxID=283734 RepID=UPI0012B911CD|nr:hypothetical protein [Staphylococcus pseudintermedius]EGQ2712151.1 hypothetical protein [Staphylococcus pseudintermedius]EGQ3208708.1 hypothetical protein [Staphylococcus pseudintermedius]EGQ3392042.1 hypothetical protein [Staphylococcus pseudintermedius]EHT3473239.1 hypothetical protein [Staphylococcus pseudintermedius]EIE3867092.1 hypothetical protein [Staphylococcus pseudintermedius]